MSGEKFTAKKKMENLRRGYKLCSELAPTFIQRQCFSAAVKIIIEYTGIYFSGVIVSMITGGGNLDAAFRMAVVYVLLNITLALAEVFVTISKCEQLETGFTRKAKMLISKKCAELDYGKIEDPETHRMKQQAENFLCGAGFRWNGMGRILYDSRIIFEAVITIIIGIAMCFRALFLTQGNAEGFAGVLQSKWAVLLLFAVYGLLIFATNKLSAWTGRLWSAHFSDKGYNQIQRVLSFYLDFFKRRYQRGKDIRIYNQSQLLVSEWEKYVRRDMEYAGKMVKKMHFTDTWYPALVLLVDAVTYAFVIARAVSGQYTAAETVVFIMSITKLLGGVMTLLNYKVDIFDLAPLNLQHIFDFLDIPDGKYRGTIPTEKRDDNEYEFEFKHVSFKYPGSGDYVLRDINLKWRIGEKMALVGRNGSGKSTLVKLLCRLYDPTEGEITLNGIDIRKYDYGEYMALFSVVFQDSRLFSFRMAENVAADTEYDAALVEDAVRRAGLSERLDEMTDGIETYLYRDFDENGVEISGGEAQKLCLARAIYKGSPFIVLDEPTAALDPVSEHDIYTKFNSIVGTRTAIYISHRLSSCRFCDDITVLDGGRIAERGTHGKLLSDGGVYAQMWSAQAEYYKDKAGELFA